MSGFLGRWSQRKREAARGETPPADLVPDLAPTFPPADGTLADGILADPVAPAAQPPGAPAPPPARFPMQPEAPEFDVASLPPIETLDAASDFTAFLRAGVPEALKQAALRKAWVADPAIRDYLSPLDYGWDFNTPGGLPAGFASTLGEVGEKLQALLRQAIGEPEPPDPETPEPETPEPLVPGIEAPEAESDAVAPAVMVEAPREDAEPLVPEARPEARSGPAMAEGPPIPAIIPAAEAEPIAGPRRHGRALPS